MCLIPGLGRSPGGGHGNPLQYSCLKNSMDRGAWRTTDHGVAKEPWALPFRGMVFQLVCCFHRYWAYSSKSTVQPKMESCFQDRACSVSSFTSSFPLILIFFFFPLCILVWNVSADVPSSSAILYLSVSNLITSPSDSSHLPACIIRSFLCAVYLFH